MSNVDSSPLPPQQETRDKFENGDAAKPAEEPAVGAAANVGSEEDAAALRIQTVARQRQARVEVADLREKERAATKIQAVERQRQARADADARKNEQTPAADAGAPAAEPVAPIAAAVDQPAAEGKKDEDKAQERPVPSESPAPTNLNQALVFVKPHANTEAVVALTKEMLAAAKITVTAEGEVDGAAIDEQRIIDRHYATIARYATEWGADRVAPSAAALEAFEAKFGTTWAAAVEAGSVLNAAQTQAKLGNITAEELTAKWAAAADKVKLAPGLYVGRLGEADGSTFVLNGFYPGNRAKFTVAGAARSSARRTPTRRPRTASAARS
jgi:hypothetical protein